MRNDRKTVLHSRWRQALLRYRFANPTEDDAREEPLETDTDERRRAQPVLRNLADNLYRHLRGRSERGNRRKPPVPARGSPAHALRSRSAVGGLQVCQPITHPPELHGFANQ